MALLNSGELVDLIQLAVAPVFLLAGVAGLLNVFIGRLTRIIDKLERMDSALLAKKRKDQSYKEDVRTLERRQFLVMRMQNTNSAIFFATATGLMVALVILSVFATTLFSFHIEMIISIFFILAMVFLIIAFVLFLREIHFTTSFIQLKKDHLD